MIAWQKHAQSDYIVLFRRISVQRGKKKKNPADCNYCSQIRCICFIYQFHAGLGYYVYIETSNPRVAGDKARIASAFMPTTNVECLRFWFHMYGATIDTLNVFSRRVDSSLGTLVWSRNGDRGDQWFQGFVKVSETTSYQVTKVCVCCEHNIVDITVH